MLLATGGGNLVYFEIGPGTLTQVRHVQLEYEVSCLDINPVGEDPDRSHLAAVGMWTDISVRIFSLPNLEMITKEGLGGEIIPRSVLFCAFEGVSYWFVYASFSVDESMYGAPALTCSWMWLWVRYPICYVP